MAFPSLPTPAMPMAGSPQPTPMAPPAPPPPIAAPAASLPLPEGMGVAFWRGEVDRAETEKKKYREDWKTNIDWYAGKAPQLQNLGKDAINVNVDFYEVEQKLSQLFYETPELQLRGTGPLRDQEAVLQAHRDLLNELLDESNVLERAIHPAIKDCLAVSGVGPVLVGYQPTLREVTPPTQPGSILGLNGPVQVPIYKQWYGLRFSPDKLLIPADWHDVPGDLTPWLGMRFRMPLNIAKREFKDAFLQSPHFTGTTARDEHVLGADEQQEASGLSYVDGQVIFYKAAYYDETAIHPELYRELVLIDGLDVEARHRDSPHQTILPDGRLTSDSMIGNPIHPLSIRSVPDSAYTPSDTKMTRDLVKELCRFRTQMMMERDASRSRFLYDVEKITPKMLELIEQGTVGAMIGAEPGALAAGVNTIMAQVVQGQSPRQTFIAQDKIEQDIAKTHAIDATGAGVSNADDETATKTAEIARSRNVRLDAERRAVLRWYLAFVDKFSSLICRYMNPDEVAQYIGPQAAQAWAQWDKRAVSGRVAFSAKPDSQIRLDAAQERKFALQLYQMTANDPNVVRVQLLKNLFTKAGYDPQQMVVDQLPEQKPKPNISYAFKGEDFVAPQGPIVLEVMAQTGIQISQGAADQAAGQMFKQVALGLRDAGGKPVPQAIKTPMEHGGPAVQVRGLSKQQGDQTGDRSGPKAQTEAPAA